MLWYLLCKYLQCVLFVPSGLDLSHNRLTKLPVDFSNLARLEELNLSSNQFDRLPVVLATIPSLRVVDLSHNQIIDINEEELKSMAALERLDLHSNPLTDDTIQKLTTLSVAKLTITFDS